MNGKRTTDGFTAVELIISITVAGLMVGVLFLATFRFFANAMQSQQTAELALESQTLLGQLVEDLRLDTGVEATNVLTDAHEPGSGWQTSDSGNVLVIATPAIDDNQDIIYDPDTGFPYQNEIIYFVSGRTMYKRTLQNATATGTTLRTSCPAAAATNDCPADRVFTENIDDLTFTLYDDTNTVTTDPAAARSVELTLHLAKEVFGKPITLSNTTRVTQRNF